MARPPGEGVGRRRGAGLPAAGSGAGRPAPALWAAPEAPGPGWLWLEYGGRRVRYHFFTAPPSANGTASFAPPAVWTGEVGLEASLRLWFGGLPVWHEAAAYGEGGRQLYPRCEAVRLGDRWYSQAVYGRYEYAGLL